MSAATVAARLTPDPATQSEIVRLLDRNQYTDRELEAVLLVIEVFLEGFREGGGEVTTEILMRAGAVGVDTVWAMRRRP